MGATSLTFHEYDLETIRLKTNYKLENVGDRYLRVSFREPPSHELTLRLIEVRAALAQLPGVAEAIHGYTSVLAEISDGLADVVQALPTLLADSRVLPTLIHEVHATYDGPDLRWASEHLGISVREIAELHSSCPFHVVALGSPGFIYLSMVPREITVPRMERPRLEVQAGSIGLAGRQTGIYGAPRPGGWRIIGHCTRVPKVRPGDTIRFVPA